MIMSGFMIHDYKIVVELLLAMLIYIFFTKAMFMFYGV